MSHSYATDAQTKSADLAATIVTSSTPEQIATACASVESFLHRHSPDQSRWFFSITFPTLICKIFGFDETKPQNPNGNGWIDILASANDREISDKVLNLLSPTGVLMSSITAVDRLSLVKYVFPIERLPEWVRLTLQNVRECAVLSDLCPLLKGRLKDGVPFQVQLNILEYYLFWFAYYPVCKGNCENHITISTSVSKRFRLENWAYKSIPVFGTASKPRGNEQKNSDCGNLYIRLLCTYLRFFVPLGDLKAHSPYRSSLLHYSSTYNSCVLENAEFFVQTLIHFWIVDNDFSPLSIKLCKSFGVVLPLRSILAELPPTAGLCEVVKVFMKYLNSNSVPNGVEGCDQVELIEAAAWSGQLNSRAMFSGMGSIGYWNSCIQRPLYRYILRTLLFCPVETPVKNVSQVFSLWVDYMEPWAVSLDEFPDLDNMKKDSTKTVNLSKSHQYSSSWQGFVLSNYLFYSSLAMHFIGFAHKFIHTDPEVIVQMVYKVLNVLTSSKELVDLIKNVDTVYHSVPASGSSKSMLNTLYRFVPSIREQLQDWEDGLSETDADGSFLHENWNKDLKLFSPSEDGGQQLLQLLALRAELELQVMSHDNLSNSMQLVNSVKVQMGCLFGGNIITSPPTISQAKQSEKHHEIFRPRTAGNRPTTDIRYKGDWMRRPISGDEVAWLAILLVKISGWLNEILGLNPWENGSSTTTRWPYVVVSGGGNVYGAKDTVRLVVGGVVGLGREAVKFMREHGVRVNLRMLASKKVVTVVLVVVAFTVLKRMLFSHF